MYNQNSGNQILPKISEKENPKVTWVLQQ